MPSETTSVTGVSTEPSDVVSGEMPRRPQLEGSYGETWQHRSGLLACRHRSGWHRHRRSRGRKPGGGDSTSPHRAGWSPPAHRDRSVGGNDAARTRSDRGLAGVRRVLEWCRDPAAGWRRAERYHRLHTAGFDASAVLAAVRANLPEALIAVEDEAGVYRYTRPFPPATTELLRSSSSCRSRRCWMAVPFALSRSCLITMSQSSE